MTPEIPKDVSAPDPATLTISTKEEIMDGKTSYQYVTTQLQQKNIPYGLIYKLIPDRLMLYGEDGWGIVVTPTLIFTESESGLGLHHLNSPIDLSNKNWDGKGFDWDLSSFGQEEIPNNLIPQSIAFVKDLISRAEKLKLPI